MNGFTLWKVKDEALPAREGGEWFLDRNDGGIATFTSKEEALVVCAAEGRDLWEAGIDSVRYRGRECENRDLVGWTVMEKDLLRLL